MSVVVEVVLVASQKTNLLSTAGLWTGGLAFTLFIPRHVSRGSVVSCAHAMEETLLDDIGCVGVNERVVEET